MPNKEHPYPSREPAVHLVCRCGAEFTRPAWRVRQAARQGATVHCSYACSHAARRTRTPESLAESHRAYREKNRELLREKARVARHVEQREHVLARGRSIYLRNAEVNRQRAREYAAEHREEAKARRKEWPEKNPERNAFHMARSSIAQSVGLRPRDVPDDLAVAKAEQLMIGRWVKEQITAQRIEAGTDETPKEVQPEGREPGPKDAPDPRISKGSTP